MLLEALRAVAANPSIRRAELAWLLGHAGQWVYLISVLVYAYDIGGVVAAGLASMLRMLPAAVMAPFITTLADRLPPNRVLLAVHGGRAVIVGAIALVVAGGFSPAFVFGAIVLEGVLATLHRPTTMALLPALARSPQELVATNAVTSTAESTGTLVGPAIGGVLLALGGPVFGLVATAVGFTVAAVTVLGIDARRPIEADAGTGSRLREMLGGFAALRAYPSAGLLIALFSAQTFVRGILTVLLVAVSVELLRLGESGVGWLNSAIGAGGLFGAFLTFALVMRRHLATPYSLALAGWGLPIVLIGLLPVTPVAFVALAVLGLANAILDVSGFSLLQRCVPNALRGRVFGALEGIVSLTWGLGSLTAPLLVELFGVRGALIAAGALLPTLSLLSARLVREADDAAVVPHHQVGLLRGVPMFAPLPMTILEQIASGLVDESHATGAEVIRQGDSGDCWYLVVEGAVDIVHDGRHVATLEGGDGFGEIALLSQRPRTASVVVRDDARLYRLPRTVFLEAVTGSPHAMIAGEALVSRRLAELGHHEAGSG
jgi:MFS family permease